MIWLKLVAASAVWERAFEAHPDPGKRDLVNKDYFVVEVSDPEPLAAAHGWVAEEPFPIVDHWLFSTLHSDVAVGKRSSDAILLGASNFYASEDSKLRRRMPIPENSEKLADIQAEFDIHDPLFKNQWHIFNDHEPGHDMNVIPVWRRNITGKGVTVAIVDDGLDYDHPDFEETFSLEGSWDYNLHQQLPKPLLADDTHGTRCAGEVAAGKNNVCGVGIAPGAKVAGIRILSGQLTTADEARSLIHRFNINDIYSCSWGPPDDGLHIEGPPPIVKRAEVEGIENGRNGKGAIYVVASGNGDLKGDNCNFDGYTNSVYSITVSAIDRQNRHPYYAESCSANLVVTYSSNYYDKITTCDRLDPLNPDKPACSGQHSGTSAAAPIAAGVFALVLEQRPDLTWRDLQYLVRETAKKFDIMPSDVLTPPNRVSNDWQTTADGHHYHNSYGYGLLDADEIVRRAETWELVKPQTWYFLKQVETSQPITETSTFSLEISKNEWEIANMDYIEHVRVRVSWEYEYRGLLRFQLESPAGIISDLAAPRERDNSNEKVENWEFLSVVHWNETGAGMWKLRVTGPEGHHGIVYNWQLKFFGVAKDPSLVKKYSEVWNDYEKPAEVVKDAWDQPDVTTTESAVETAEPTTEPAVSTAEPAESTSDSASAEPTSAQSPAQTDAPGSAEPTATGNPAAPTDDTKPLPEPEHKPHSIWYYIVVSIAGILVLSVIIVPTVYFGFWVRKRSSRYIELDDEAFEIEGDDFVIDDEEFADSLTDIHESDLPGSDIAESDPHEPYPPGPDVPEQPSAGSR